VFGPLATVRAGARQIPGTLNGLGERCGNANLVTLIGNLKLKPDYLERRTAISFLKSTAAASIASSRRGAYGSGAEVRRPDAPDAPMPFH
jgi:isopropylmalate/homocitrate/citramalate synthase